MKKTLLLAALVLPLTLSACSGASSLLLNVGGLLTDVCSVNRQPQIVSVGVTKGQIDVTYYRKDTTLGHALFDTSAAPYLSALPGTVTFPVTVPTHCD